SFLAMMDLARDCFAGFVFGGRENDPHFGAGQVGALHLLAVRRILRLRKAGKSGGGNKDGEPFCGGEHVVLPVLSVGMIAEIAFGWRAPLSSLRAQRSNPGRLAKEAGLLRRCAPRNDENYRGSALEPMR